MFTYLLGWSKSQSNPVKAPGWYLWTGTRPMIVPIFGPKQPVFSMDLYTRIVQELCESPGLSVLTSLLVFVDVKSY